MSKSRLADAMSARSPLAPREAVRPINLYSGGAPDVKADETADPATSSQGDMTTNGQVHKTTPPLAKYTTHLRPETIKAVKQAALDGDCKDYQIVQRALDAYLKRDSPPI